MNKDDLVTERETNYAHVLERVAKTETSVAALENDMRTVMAGVSDIRGMLMESQKGKDPNYGLWIGLVAAGLLGIAQYVDITLDPLEVTVANRGTDVSNFYEFKHQTHYEFGMLHEWRGSHKKEVAHIDDRMHKLEDRLRDTEIEAATTAARLEKVEDEVEKVDAYGSRRWGNSLNE